jgi:hypothetical protein
VLCDNVFDLFNPFVSTVQIFAKHRLRIDVKRELARFILWQGICFDNLFYNKYTSIVQKLLCLLRTLMRK